MRAVVALVAFVTGCAAAHVPVRESAGDTTVLEPPPVLSFGSDDVRAAIHVPSWAPDVLANASEIDTIELELVYPCAEMTSCGFCRAEGPLSGAPLSSLVARVAASVEDDAWSCDSQTCAAHIECSGITCAISAAACDGRGMESTARGLGSIELERNAPSGVLGAIRISCI